jgi:RND family efflux transporter MFP subunit
VAPFDGIVTDRSVDPGSMAAPGTPLLTLDSLGSLQFEARLDAARVAAISAGQTVAVRIDTDPQNAAPAAGRVVEVSRIDAGGHRFAVKIDVAPNTAWRAGLFGRALFAGASRRAIAIPASAVVRRGQLAFVFVAADGRARLRAVSLGESAGERVEILDGLSAGEHILLAPPAALADGTRISVAGGAR